MCRAVMPAGVEEPVMMSVALDFGARASSVGSVVILYAGATFLARPLACFFVSHNYVLSLIVFFSRLHITRRGGGTVLYVNSRARRQAPRCGGNALMGTLYQNENGKADHQDEQDRPVWHGKRNGIADHRCGPE